MLHQAESILNTYLAVEKKNVEGPVQRKVTTAKYLAYTEEDLGNTKGIPGEENVPDGQNEAMFSGNPLASKRSESGSGTIADDQFPGIFDKGNSDAGGESTGYDNAERDSLGMKTDQGVIRLPEVENAVLVRLLLDGSAISYRLSICDGYQMFHSCLRMAVLGMTTPVKSPWPQIGAYPASASTRGPVDPASPKTTRNEDTELSSCYIPNFVRR